MNINMSSALSLMTIVAFAQPLIGTLSLLFSFHLLIFSRMKQVSFLAIGKN